MHIWQEIIYTEQLLNVKKQSRLKWRELVDEFPPFTEKALKKSLVSIMRQGDFFRNGAIMPQEYRELCKNSLYLKNVYYKTDVNRLVTSVKIDGTPVKISWRVEQSGKAAQSIAPDDVPAAVTAAIVERVHYLLNYWITRPQDAAAAKSAPLARVKTWA